MRFDYIIIGAGSAGCVLANRLSQDGKTSVALIEAGGSNINPWIHIPIGYFKTLNNSQTDWCYKTEPEIELNDRSLSWPRGKVIGGSSSINGLLYVRGQSQDFDNWKFKLGNLGWGWDDVFPYFKKLENWNGLNPDNMRGTSGPLQITESKTQRLIVDKWLEAAQTMGYKKNSDYNINQEGVGLFQLTLKNGFRCSSADAYLKPAKKRKNLAIIKNTLVSKILLINNKAIGIEATQHNNPLKIMANREVIISAGAISSPQLLMLSGIGNAQELKGHNIEVINNLVGVGRNLQDHLQARPVFKTNLPTLNNEAKNYFGKIRLILEYLVSRSGPMSMAASLGVGFLKTSKSLSSPDIQFHIQPFSVEDPTKGTHRFSAFTTSVTQLRPKSMGCIKLKSSNILDYPLIYPNYLNHNYDKEILIKGVQVALKIASLEPLKSSLTGIHSPRNINPQDKARILNWIRQNAVTIYHPVGTCKMGSDKLAVVNERLLVHGVRGLRVVDASIMPKITSGNTNAPTLMIGEKAADMILKDNKND